MKYEHYITSHKSVAIKDGTYVIVLKDWIYDGYFKAGQIIQVRNGCVGEVALKRHFLHRCLVTAGFVRRATVEELQAHFD